MKITPRQLIAGNWKMHGTKLFASEFARDLAGRFASNISDRFDLLLCPPAPLLTVVGEVIQSTPIALGGQDCHATAQGPHTGDVSAGMLMDVGCTYVIAGHSERRSNHRETDAVVRDKSKTAQKGGLIALICVGETLEQRETGNAVERVVRQLRESLPDGSQPQNTVVAYEPVWAIGTGKTPTPDDIAEVHLGIRIAISELMDNPGELRILYGGSVKPENAAEILAVPNVNGALVGGASLKPDNFWAIAQGCP